MAIPIEGNFLMFGTSSNDTIAGAIIEGGANAETVSYTLNFNALKALANINKFDTNYSEGATTLEEIVKTIQFRGYPIAGTTTTTAAPTTTTTTVAPTSTTTTTLPGDTTTTTTTTTAAPSTDCYVIETVQSSQGECFDCEGFFASSTDTIIRFLDDCSGSITSAPFDINVTAHYSDNSTEITFIAGGTVGDVLIAFSDVQCAPLPSCGEIASPTFDFADVVPVSGSINECCVAPPTTTTTTTVSEQDL